MLVKRLIVFTPLVAALTLLGCGEESDPRGALAPPPEDPVGEAAEGLCYAPPYDEFIALNGNSPRWTQLPNGLSGTDITSQLTTLVANLPTTAATGGASTLYIPPGTYYLHSTLQLVDGFGVNIVGDDASTTTIVWTGASGADMVQMVDDGYSKLSRLTLNGNNLAGALVNVIQSACYSAAANNAMCNLPVPSSPNVSGAGGSYFLEFNDDVFSNAQFGIVGNYGMTASVVPESCVPWAASTANCGPGGTPALCCYGNPAGPVYTPPAAGQIPAVNSNLGNFIIRRSTFSNLTGYGIVTGNQNALDWLVADSKFFGIGFGGPAGLVSAAIGRLYNGSYVVTNNSFANNNRDILLQGPAADVVRGNTSINSNAFLWAGGGSWNYELDVSQNYILTSGGFVSNPGVNECAWAGFPPYGMCISVSNLTMIDNYLNVPGGVGVFTTGTPEIVEGGNSMALGNSLITPWNGYGPPTVLNIATDTVGSGAPVPAPAQYAYNSVYAAGNNAWGTTPSKATRTVYNIQNLFADCTLSTGNCGSELSNWLLTAPQNSAVYFPAVFSGTNIGTYYIKTPIDVPAGLDVTFFGDGANSKIEWAGAVGGASDPYMFHFKAGGGLSPIGSVRDIELLATNAGTSRPGGILVDVLDNTGDMVFVDTVMASFTKSLLDVIGVDKTSVRADQSGGGNEHMVGVTGAGAGVNGSANTAGVVMFGGGGNPSATMVDLRNWGKAVLIGTDNEGYTQGYTLTQSGYLTMDGGRLISGVLSTNCGSSGQPPGAYGCCTGLFNKAGVCTLAYAAQPNIVVQSTFKGTATFMNLDDGAAIFSASNPQAKVLALSNGFATAWGQAACSTTACTFTQQNPAQQSAYNQMAVFDWDMCSPVLLYACDAQPTSGGSTPTLPPAGANGSVATMLTDLRATNEAPPLRSCGLANVRLHRIFFEGITTSDPADFMRSAVRVQHN